MDTDTTVHWHGPRLENAYDGVPHETQEPIPPGGASTRRQSIRDPDVYWCHLHVRESYAQELGSYGNVIVDAGDASYWPPADRQFVFTLDDILIEDGTIAPIDPQRPNYTAIGRFANVLLVGGKPGQQLHVGRGETVRLYLTKTV